MAGFMMTTQTCIAQPVNKENQSWLITYPTRTFPCCVITVWIKTILQCTMVGTGPTYRVSPPLLWTGFLFVLTVFPWEGRPTLTLIGSTGRVSTVTFVLTGIKVGTNTLTIWPQCTCKGIKYDTLKISFARYLNKSNQYLLADFTTYELTATL